MSDNPTVHWASEFPFPITVCDAEGTVVEMNRASQALFAKNGGAALIGTDLRDCHPGASRDKLEALLTEPRPNIYAILKNGQKKIIVQSPWYENGVFAGLVELSIPLPPDMPVFDRDKGKKEAE